MSPERFNTGKQFFWQGEIYEVRRLLANSNVSIVSVKTGEPRTVAFLELLKAFYDGAVRFVVDGQPVTRTLACAYEDLRDCPEPLRAMADYRLEVIKPLLDLPRRGRKKAIRERVAELKKQQEQDGNGDAPPEPLSVTSTYRWIKDLTRSGGDKRVLVSNKGRRGNRKSRLTAEEEQVVNAVFGDECYRPELRTIDYLHREIAVRVAEENRTRPPEEQLRLPNRSTVARRLTTLDGAELLVARRGRRAAERELAQHGEMDYPALPLARVEIDHTRYDIVVIDENDSLPLGRLTFTHALDTATRYPLGFYLGFEPPSYLAVMECLYHVIRPKEDTRTRYETQHEWIAHGVPYTLVVDNGKDFIGRDLDDVCAMLGITLVRAPVMDPEFKAAVERMFGTVNTGLLHTLPGTTFSNILKRGDYDSMRQACVCLEDLEQILHIFLLDLYAENKHRGLGGIPARRWEAALRDGFFPRVPQSPEELRILLGRVEYRAVLPYGIEFHSLRYNCDELAPLRARLRGSDNRVVKIKYNPGDLGRIYVYDPEENRHIEVPALAQEYTRGLSLWKHLVICRYARKHQDQVDIAALGWAQRKIQEIVQRSMERKATVTRAAAARWQGIGTGRLSGRQAELAAAAQLAELPGGTPLPALPGPGLDFDLEEVEREAAAAPLPSPATSLLDFDLEEEEPAAAEAAPPLPAVDLDFDLEDLAAEGWRVSHDLPGARKEK